MIRFLKLFTVLLAISFVQVCSAQEYKVLVLPDNIEFSSTNYYIYPDSSVIFATDTINEFKKNGFVKTVSMTEVRDTLRKNTKLALLTQNALKEYKYNYNIPFVDFKAIAKSFDTNKVLVITSQTDVQNYFLRRTLWDVLNIPGAAVIDPAYKMSTFVSLIDVDKEQILWQQTYYKKLTSVENCMIAANFAPATEQLKKIKSYSSYFLSPIVAQTVQSKIVVEQQPVINQNDNIINISDIKIQENIPEIKTDLKINVPVPIRPDVNENGVIINDI